MNSLYLAIVSALMLTTFFVPVHSAVCSSNQYCPNGWKVLRRPDQSAHTCDPMQYDIKCPKPYRCVHSKCGISFCCTDPDTWRRWQVELELAEEMQEDDEL